MRSQEFPGRTYVPWKFPYEDPLEVRLVANVVVWKEFKPCPDMFPHANGKVLDDEIVIVHSSGLTGEPEVFEPNAWVSLPSVFGDVGGRPETLWERCSPDASAEGPWSLAIRAGTLVVWSATMPGVCVPALLDGQAWARVACSRRHSIDVIVVSDVVSIVDDAASVKVQPELFTHRLSMWTGHRVRLWCSHSLLPYAQQL